MAYRDCLNHVADARDLSDWLYWRVLLPIGMIVVVGVLVVWLPGGGLISFYALGSFVIYSAVLLVTARGELLQAARLINTLASRNAVGVEYVNVEWMTNGVLFLTIFLFFIYGINIAQMIGMAQPLFAQLVVWVAIGAFSAFVGIMVSLWMTLYTTRKLRGF